MTDDDSTKRNEATLRDFLKYSVCLIFAKYSLQNYLSKVKVEFMPINTDSNFQYANVTAYVDVKQLSKDSSITNQPTAESKKFAGQLGVKITEEVCDLFKDIMRQNGPCALFQIEAMDNA